MRQPRNGNLRLPIKKTPRLLRDAFLSYDNLRQSIPKCPITIISCYVISNKFPRLLAEREIIANAFYQQCLRTWLYHELLQRYNIFIIKSPFHSLFYIKIKKGVTPNCITPFVLRFKKILFRRRGSAYLPHLP